MDKAPCPQQMAQIHASAFTQSRPWSADEFSALLNSPLCFASGDAHCFALVRIIADEAELLTIATAPGFQRQGRARAVMQNWQCQARARGATTCLLEVAADNTAAQHLYRAEGFAPCGRRKAYYPRPDAVAADAIVMQKEFP